jgi:hypothetical protein
MPRKQLVVPCLALALTILPLFAALARDGEQALLLRDFHIEAVSESPLPRLNPGEIVACPAVLRDGYLIVMRDSQDNLRGALMPFTDEWGHATARAWTHDPTLEKHRLLIRRPAVLQPYGIVLNAGDLYPVTAQSDRFVQIEYRCADEMSLLTLPRDAVTIQQPAGMTHEQTLEANLTRSLETQREEQARLRAAIDETEAYLSRIAQLLLDVNKAQLETATLKGEMTINRELKQALGRLNPTLAQQQSQKSAALQATLEKQAPLRRREQDERLTQTVIANALQAQRQAVVELARWKAQAGRASATRTAVAATAGPGGKTAELNKATSAVRKAARLQTQLAAQLATSEQQEASVTTAVDLLLDLLETNQELMEELQAVEQTRSQNNAQLAEVRQQLHQVDQALNPAPAVTPPTTPTVAEPTDATKAPTPTRPNSNRQERKQRPRDNAPVEEKGAPTAVEQIWSTTP